MTICLLILKNKNFPAPGMTVNWGCSGLHNLKIGCSRFNAGVEWKNYCSYNGKYHVKQDIRSVKWKISFKKILPDKNDRALPSGERTPPCPVGRATCPVTPPVRDYNTIRWHSNTRSRCCERSGNRFSEFLTHGVFTSFIMVPHVWGDTSKSCVKQDICGVEWKKNFT